MYAFFLIKMLHMTGNMHVCIYMHTCVIQQFRLMILLQEEH